MAIETRPYRWLHWPSDIYDVEDAITGSRASEIRSLGNEALTIEARGRLSVTKESASEITTALRNPVWVIIAITDRHAVYIDFWESSSCGRKHQGTEERRVRAHHRRLQGASRWHRKFHQKSNKLIAWLGRTGTWTRRSTLICVDGKAPSTQVVYGQLHLHVSLCGLFSQSAAIVRSGRL